MACELDYEGNREIFDLRLDVDIRCKWRALSTSNPSLPRMGPYVTFLGRLWRPAFLYIFLVRSLSASTAIEDLVLNSRFSQS